MCSAVSYVYRHKSSKFVVPLFMFSLARSTAASLPSDESAAVRLATGRVRGSIRRRYCIIQRYGLLYRCPRCPDDRLLAMWAKIIYEARYELQVTVMSRADFSRHCVLVTFLSRICSLHIIGHLFARNFMHCLFHEIYLDKTDAYIILSRLDFRPNAQCAPVIPCLAAPSDPIHVSRCPV